MSENAFSHAVRAFNKARTNSVQALRIAINEYKFIESEEAVAARPAGLELVVVDTPRGADTALVITGFNNISEIESFIKEFLHAPRK